MLRQRRNRFESRITFELSANGACSTTTGGAGDGDGGASGSSSDACGSECAIAALMLSRARLDRADHLVQHAEPEFPGVHHYREILVDRHHGLDLGPLVGIERAEGVFRGERDMVFAVGHHHPSPRHSRISNRLRRSQVFTVFTGVSNFCASCSRLHPL